MATESCDFRLAANIAADCATKAVKGLRNTAWIMNYDDIDFDATKRSSTNPNIVETLVLKSGKKAYRAYVPGKNPFTGTKKSMSAGTYRNRFNKDLSIVILDNGPEVSRNIVDQLANGTFVAVVQNKFAGSDGKNTYEILGIETGLTATALDDDKYSDDSEGGWLCTLQEENAPTSGIYYYNESLTATAAALDALVSK